MLKTRFIIFSFVMVQFVFSFAYAETKQNCLQELNIFVGFTYNVKSQVCDKLIARNYSSNSFRNCLVDNINKLKFSYSGGQKYNQRFIDLTTIPSTCSLGAVTQDNINP